MPQESRLGVNRKVWEGSGPLGIPSLLPSLLVRSWEETDSLFVWNTGPIPSGKTACFWVDDFRFESCWTKPTLVLHKLKEAGIRSCVEPDYSLYPEDPLVLRQHNLYKARWVARYWQEWGIPVIPNLSWGTLDDLSWSLDGIPSPCPLLACECRPRFRKVDELISALTICIRRLRPRKVLLYGAKASLLPLLPRGPVWQALSAWSPAKRIAGTLPK